MSKTAQLWILWIAASLIGTGAMAGLMLVGGDRRALLIGETTGVHHQFEVACETCHAAEPLSSAKQTTKKLNKTCVGCHKEELKASDDSHPGKKFKNPRMADYWTKIDVRFCTSCHIEHRPEITRTGAVTLAMNYCVACHSEGEQDVRKNRKSHADLTFDTCASAGCHNFHDNRALYEDFLVKHVGQKWLKSGADGGLPAQKLAAQLRGPLDEAGLQAEIATWLAKTDAVAPKAHLTPEALSDWVGSGHAKAGVNCAGCHAPDLAKETDLQKIEAAWVERPEQQVCGACHKDERKTFRLGRHGMRQHPKIAKPRDLDKRLKKIGLSSLKGDDLPKLMRRWLEEPALPKQMTVAEARVPMHAHAQDRSMTCSSCHGSHKADPVFASVEACVSCHADEHSQNYAQSRHYERWLAEVSGEAAPGTGVSCADCHMPKVEAGSTIFTNHNQNDVLRPNEKMIRPVCLDCHGLAFAIDALADPKLVARNFTGRPAVHVESIDWAARRVREGDQGDNQ